MKNENDVFENGPKPLEVVARRVTSWEELQELCRDDWSNNAALGYLIAGLEQNDFKPDQIQKIVNHMRNRFDFLTIEEAKEVYNKSPY